MGARPFTPRIVVNAPDRRAAWEEFAKDERLHQTYAITEEEMESLKQSALLGNIRSKRDFVFMLNIIRRRRRNDETEVSSG